MENKNKITSVSLCLLKYSVFFSIFSKLTGALGFSEFSEFADLSEFGEIRRTCGQSRLDFESIVRGDADGDGIVGGGIGADTG